PRGEVTLVLGPAEATNEVATDDEARSAVSDLVEAGASRRTAAEVVARLTGASRNALYRDSL
ncbi:MAG: 16S rRNA (cytidine(1402)-2'-O)-methyltransferase, partial [Gaiellaceae bacterium]